MRKFAVWPFKLLYNLSMWELTQQATQPDSPCVCHALSLYRSMHYLLFTVRWWIVTHPRLGKPYKSGLDIMLSVTWRIQRGESSQFSCQGQPGSYSSLFYPAYSYLSKRWQVHSIKNVSHCSCDKPIQVSWSLKISSKSILPLRTIVKIHYLQRWGGKTRLDIYRAVLSHILKFRFRMDFLPYNSTCPNENYHYHILEKLKRLRLHNSFEGY
jgi:hypothetical protein